MKSSARHLRSVPSNPKPPTQIVGERYLNQRDWERLLLGSVILPVQYNDQIRRPRILEGEQKLMFAVLEDAVREYLQGGDPQSFQEFTQRRELKQWFAARDHSSIFTFESLCETFGIDARGLWESLQSQERLRHHQRQMATPATDRRRPFDPPEAV